MTIDWDNLWFAYRPTNTYVKVEYKNWKWWTVESVKWDTITLPIAATCLHYGQQIFEGMKAFRQQDTTISIFRPEENALRMQNSAKRVMMQAPNTELFINVVKQAVQENEAFVPPYGSGASLYIRPLLLWTQAQIGVKPSEEYTFLVFVMPVGAYYKDGLSPIQAIIAYDYDRAAPLGVGNCKVWGNYASGMQAGAFAHQQWYNVELYLDAKEKKYIDECGTANFFAIKWDKYITPHSDSILPSITNKSLRILAEKNGLTVENRKIAVEELSAFDEVWACGTAAVITPISKIYNPHTDKTYHFGDQVWPITKKLYEQFVGIQYGDLPDEYWWNVRV